MSSFTNNPSLRIPSRPSSDNAEGSPAVSPVASRAASFTSDFQRYVQGFSLSPMSMPTPAEQRSAGSMMIVNKAAAGTEVGAGNAHSLPGSSMSGLFRSSSLQDMSATLSGMFSRSPLGAPRSTLSKQSKNKDIDWMFYQ